MESQSCMCMYCICLYECRYICVYGYVSIYMHVFIYVEEEINLACYSSEAAHFVL